MEYTVIATHDDTTKLSAGFNIQKGLYYGTALEIKSHGLNLFWDNDEFLFGDLYIALKNYRDRVLTPLNLADLEEIKQSLDENDGFCEDLIEIIERAIQKGWDKLD